MNAREENLKCVKDIVETQQERLRAIQAECGKMLQDCENILKGLMVEAQLGRTVATVNPLEAPEIVGADKNGEGGDPYRPRIELDE